MTSSKSIFKRKTKIIATIGPATESPDILTQAIKAGLDIARLNFSHGSHAEHGARAKNVRAIAKRLKTDTKVMGDLQGPKMRIGKMPEIQFKKGQMIVLDTSTRDYIDEKIPFQCDIFARGTRKGDIVFFRDGMLSAEITKVDGQLFHARIIKGGELSSGQGVNAPNLHLRSSILEHKDREDLKFCLELSVDYLALSFVRTAEDIREVRRLMEGAKKKPKIIAKIERPEALTNIREILKEVDGIMFARGDLGVETPLTQLPLRQKEVVALANKMGKFAIVATQMMETMRHNPMPTRAEVSDVANAVFDGADAVMLSAETSTGHYPLETLTMMRDIVVETEKYLALKKR